MIELRHLQHFTAVVRFKSFRRAADTLGVSQSAMTKSIARLEDELQLRLFNRTTRSVEPTDSARALLAAAESTVRAWEGFGEQARLLSGGKLGALRVGVIALASETLIAQTLTTLSQTHPELDVEVVVGSVDVYQDLVSGECDAVVGDEANFLASPHARSLRMTPIREDTIVLLHRTGHPYAGADQRAALLAQPLAIPSRYYNENSLFQAFARAGGPASPRYRLNHLSSCINLVRGSNVVSLVPESVARQFVAAGDVTVADIELGIVIRFVLVTLAAHSPTPGIRALAAALGT